ncbi:hypothetical protein C2869_05295 [Saccharobesus litoralis]|uniref:Uncharacterized protein n=1 Tax=Saccharobesus litoralis TaxID=2172099 RepID=A0A2S0VNU4_9ALTE|nr:cytochrome b562 [Saccharobesus litoralis]AWB65891.1 hypothetical protein C2869_05295 [Saccharobesus litoralis]
MKKLLLTCLLTLCFLPTTYAAHPQCGKTELSSVMKDMKDALKGYKTAMKKQDEAGMKTHSQALYDLSVKSKEYVPLSISDKSSLSAEEKAKYAKYQKGMDMMAKAVKKLMNATDDATRKAALAVIGKGNKQGHRNFKMKCK